MGRRLVSRHKPLQTKGAWDRLVGVAERLGLLGSLSAGEARSVKEAVEILNLAQTTPKRMKYKQFLHDVYSKPGPHAVLVCAVALGQVKVVDMRSNDRNGLIRQIQEGHTVLNHPTLQALAISYRILNSVNDLQPVQIPELNPKARQPVRQIGSNVGQVEPPNQAETQAKSDTKDARPMQQISIPVQPNTQIQGQDLTGDVYELTHEDARTVTMLQQIPGQVFLTDTYDINTLSFITIPISDELSRRFAMQRTRVMSNKLL